MNKKAKIFNRLGAILIFALMSFCQFSPKTITRWSAAGLHKQVQAAEGVGNEMHSDSLPIPQMLPQSTTTEESLFAPASNPTLPGLAERMVKLEKELSREVSTGLALSLSTLLITAGCAVNTALAVNDDNHQLSPTILWSSAAVFALTSGTVLSIASFTKANLVDNEISALNRELQSL